VAEYNATGFKEGIEKVPFQEFIVTRIRRHPNFSSRGQWYKAFYGRKLRIFVKS
jgi:hypothetical protein